MKFMSLNNYDELEQVVDCHKKANEDQLEDFVEKNINLISENLLLIGRQVGTAFGTCIDLLCLDKNGSLVTLELKNTTANRNTVSQVLDYAVWLKTLKRKDISSIFESYSKYEQGINIPNEFKKKFNINLPDFPDKNIKSLIIAPSFDQVTKRIIFHLNDSGIMIDAMSINFYHTKNTTFLTVDYLLDSLTFWPTEPNSNLTKEISINIANENEVLREFLSIRNFFKEKCTSEAYTQNSICYTGQTSAGKKQRIIHIYPYLSNQEDGISIGIYTNLMCESLKISIEEFFIKINEIIEVERDESSDSTWLQFHLKAENLPNFIQIINELANQALNADRKTSGL